MLNIKICAINDALRSCAVTKRETVRHVRHLLKVFSASGAILGSHKLFPKVASFGVCMGSGKLRLQCSGLRSNTIWNLKILHMSCHYLLNYKEKRSEFMVNSMHCK